MKTVVEVVGGPFQGNYDCNDQQWAGMRATDWNMIKMWSLLTGNFTVGKTFFSGSPIDLEQLRAGAIVSDRGQSGHEYQVMGRTQIDDTMTARIEYRGLRCISAN
jgi:hypothetical protein